MSPSIEDDGPGPGNRWLNRDQDILEGWVAQWATRLAQSGPKDPSSLVGRWPFPCPGCGTDFRGFTPRAIRRMRRHVLRYPGSSGALYHKAHTHGRCCERSRRGVWFTFRMDRDTPYKPAIPTLVDAQEGP